MSNEGNVLDKHDIDIPGQVNIDVENVEIRQVREGFIRNKKKS